MAKMFDAWRLVWGATDMRGADLSGLGDLSVYVSTVEGVNLDGADLRGTSFVGVSGVQSASFVGATMDDVDSGAASAPGAAPDMKVESPGTGLVHMPGASAEHDPVVDAGDAPDMTADPTGAGLVHTPGAAADQNPVLDAEPEYDWVSPDIIDVDVEVVETDNPAAEMDAAVVPSGGDVNMDGADMTPAVPGSDDVGVDGPSITPMVPGGSVGPSDSATEMDQADIDGHLAHVDGDLGPDFGALAVVDAMRRAILGTVEDAQTGLRSYVRPRGL